MNRITVEKFELFLFFLLLYVTTVRKVISRVEWFHSNEIYRTTLGVLVYRDEVHIRNIYGRDVLIH